MISKNKRYEGSFLGSGKKITLIGINFDSEKRNFDEWTAENFVTKESAEG